MDGENVGNAQQLVARMPSPPLTKLRVLYLGITTKYLMLWIVQLKTVCTTGGAKNLTAMHTLNVNMFD